MEFKLLLALFFSLFHFMLLGQSSDTIKNASNEKEILKLSLTNKNLQLQLIKKDKTIYNKNIWLCILVFVLLSIIIVYSAILQQQKASKQNLKIEKLQAVYQSQENTKKRIARDLHDIISTNFDGLRLKILALKRSSNTHELIDNITNELKNINQQIRSVSHRLHPLEVQITKQKFTDVIKSRLSEFQLYGKVFVELEVPLSDILNDLEINVQNHFYGILLEILNNVEKHAQATKLNITNKTDTKSNIYFTFTDNGIGIKNEVEEGIGLLNIRQRCEIIGGSCCFKNIETGTKVKISFPLKKMIYA